MNTSNNNTKAGSSNSISLKQFSVLAKANQGVNNSDWYWGNNYGKCDGTVTVGDAAIILGNELLSLQVTPPLPLHKYYTNVDYNHNGNNGWYEPIDDPLPSGQTNPFGYYNYYLFNYYKNQGSFGPCLTVSQISYYLGNIQYLEQKYKPANKEIAYTIVFSDFDLSVPTYSILHKIQPRYGIKHLTNYIPDNEEE